MHCLSARRGAPAVRFSLSLRFLAGAALILIMSCADLGPSNIPPTADFTVTCAELTCQLTDGSVDPDGTIAAYSWDFGDGGVSTETDPAHTYGAPGGEFNVRLKVTDNRGDTATAQTPVTVVVGNVAPVAAFSVSCTNLTCQLTNGSTDSDGTIAAYSWDFGDGAGSSEPNPTHTYGAPGGQFTVQLTVTDDDGDTATAQTPVTVTMPTSLPDRSGTYERETPHSAAGRNSRYVIRADNTFEVRDWFGTDTTTYTGRWRFVEGWLGWDTGPGSVIRLDFDGIVGDPFCFGEAFGSFLFDGHLAIAYCGFPVYATGLEEGVYSSAPLPSNPGPPPQTGQIAFVRDGAIYLANSDGGGLVQLTAGPNDHGPAWSPDGSQIAFARSPAETGLTSAIFVMNADGANVVQRAASGSNPTWSPDGEWIAFEGAGGILKVRTDGVGGTPDTVFNEAGQNSGPAWSPDGSRIAFTSDRELYDILFSLWLIAPDGTQLTALTSHTPASIYPGEHYALAWSPDGRRVAYASCPWASSFCSSSAVTVMNADGSGLVYLAAASGFAGHTWSADGQVIVYASSNTIAWVSADGTQRGRILDRGHSPAWRPQRTAVRR